MKILLIYLSPNGTTKTVAQKLFSEFKHKGYEVDDLNLGEIAIEEWDSQLKLHYEKCDLIGIGSPLYHMDILQPVTNLFKRFLSQVSGLTKVSHPKKAFIFINYAGITSGKAFKNTSKLLTDNGVGIVGGIKIFAPHFWKRKEFPYPDTQNVISQFVNSLIQKNFSVLSVEQLKKDFREEKMRTKILYPLAHKIGQKRELSISIDHQACVKCQKCVKECPVKAISMKDYPYIDFSKCIHCYHCTVACPTNAVICPVEKLSKMITVNKRIIGMESPLNKIIV